MKDILLGVGRHILTGLGGVLVTKGYLDEASVQALVGAVLTILGIGASVLDKKAR